MRCLRMYNKFTLPEAAPNVSATSPAACRCSGSVIQLLPVFSATCQSAPECTSDADAAEQPAPRRIEKTSPSVSIFAQHPLYKNTCRHCRCRPCNVGIEYDDHTCCDCEHRLLHSEGAWLQVLVKSFFQI